MKASACPLSGVANLRGVRRSPSDAIERCARTGQILALVSVDLDEFKLVNDLYSHTMGDKVLVSAAEAMTSTVRHTNMVARRGGDEFAIVCIVDDARDLPALTIRLGEAISTARSRLTPDITSTASVGSIVWRRGEMADDFLSRADEELHGAKLHSREGRKTFAPPRSA
jgi:diguanylate cyclase (GGDEF)-like protein